MSSQYTITDYTRKQAQKYGVVVKPSEKSKYKIDVYDTNGNLITRIGDRKYKDFPTYIQERGLEYAQKRRSLYKARHEKDRHVLGSRGYFADKLLW